MNFRLSQPVKAIVLAVGYAFLVSCSHSPAVQEFPDTADASAEVVRLENDLNRDLSQQTDVLAPQSFNEASRALSSARKSLEQQKNPKDTLHYVAVGRAYLNRANAYAGIAHTNIEDVILARRDAISAGAPGFFASEFTQADRSLIRVTEDLEENETANAIEHRSELQASYMNLELLAIKQNALSGSRTTVGDAIAEGAKDYAPRSLAIAQKSLTDTDAFITANRHAQSAIATKSEETRLLAEHLLKITRDSRSGKKVSSEDTALRIEREEHKVEAGAVALSANREQLVDEQGQNRSLSRKNRHLQTSDAFNRSFEQARAEFTQGEAEVYKQGNSLVIRLRGLEFPTGQAVLVGSNFPLLAKVQKVIKNFGDSTVVVEGHTDSLGGKGLNERLSTDRALAVKDYLVANQGPQSLNISSIGYDYQKPLGTNKTASGRAQNRRVDVIIEAKDPGRT